MLRNTWESILDVVTAILGVIHSLVDVVYGVIEDVKNIVDGKEEYEEDVIDGDDLAELIKSVRKDSKGK